MIIDNYASIYIHRKREVCFGGEAEACFDRIYRCDCEEVLRLIEAGKIDTTPLITHRFPLNQIDEAYHIFENKMDGVIKVAITGEKGYVSCKCL